jgi:hypothetical protein
LANDLPVKIGRHAIEQALVPDLLEHALDHGAFALKPLWTNAGDALQRRIFDVPRKGAGIAAQLHRLAEHRARFREVGGDTIGIQPKIFENGPFVPNEPFLAHLVVDDQAVGNSSREPVLAGRRAISPVAGMGAGQRLRSSHRSRECRENENPRCIRRLSKRCGRVNLKTLRTIGGRPMNGGALAFSLKQKDGAAATLAFKFDR